MAVARLKTVSQELTLLVSRDLSPDARRKLIADTARRDLATIAAQNRAVIGDAPPPRTFVDGRASAAFETVNPDRGVIAGIFDLTLEVLEYVEAMLVLNSPVLTGQYQRSHKLFADDVEVDPDRPPPARRYVFLSDLPYARKVERGQSDQAPEGVYEVTAVLASRRYGNLARIGFTYEGVAALDTRHDGMTSKQRRQAEKDSRVPAIWIEPR